MRHATVALVLLLALSASDALGGSSLFRSGKTAPAPVLNERGEEVAAPEAPTIRSASLISVREPEPREFEVHDLVTVVVREESESSSEAESESAKDLTVNADLQKWLKFQDGRIEPDEGIAALNPGVDVNMNREFEGEGEVERKDSFLTKIAAEVIDVKPNGNLVIEAKRFIKTDEEEITMTLSGTVRPKDVDLHNLVYSSNVADLAVSKTTRGIASSGASRGWFVRILDAINPF